MSALLIILAVLAVAAIVGAVAFRRFSNIAGNILSSLFSHNSGELHITPEKPKSLNNMARIYIPQIKRDFPEYNSALMEERVKRDARTYYDSALRGEVLFTGDEAIKSFRERLTFELPHGVASQAIIHNAVLSGYDQDEHGKLISYQVAAEYRDTENMVRQTKLTLKYIASYSDEVEEDIHITRCPNCGAPLGVLGVKKCEYCGMGIDFMAGRDWRLIDIDEN